jgi:hypothetical protein
MKKCANCGNEFETRPVIGGKRKHHYKRKYCTECSPVGANNRRRLESGRAVVGGTRVTCDTCLREFVYKRGSGTLINKCSACVSRAYRRKIKQQAVDYKGGKCQECGYDSCIASLDFHHVNPFEKDFEIGSNKGSFEKLKLELDKCILLCRNCHGERHYEDWESRQVLKA